MVRLPKCASNSAHSVAVGSRYSLAGRAARRRAAGLRGPLVAAPIDEDLLTRGGALDRGQECFGVPLALLDRTDQPGQQGCQGAGALVGAGFALPPVLAHGGQV